MDAREAVREYLSRGWAPIPVPKGSKRPTLRAWQKLRLVEAEIDTCFADEVNVGLLLGEPSRGLVDVDLDCVEAERLAGVFLPTTEMCSGRARRPRTHWWYVTSGSAPATRQFTDPLTDEMLVELRSTGGQTLVAPSVHPGGDTYQWNGEMEPAVVEAPRLQRAVARLAAATMLSRHWPRIPGSRHGIANALAGMLLRAGWGEPETQAFVQSVAHVAGDEESRGRAKDAIATARALARGERVTGAPTLATLLDPKLVERLREWLGLAPSPAEIDPPEWARPAIFRRTNVPEFPIQCLPNWLRAFVEELSAAVQTPLALAGTLVLAICGLTAARRLRVEIRSGWTEPLNLYCAVAMAPGNRKSAVFSAVEAPLVKFERAEAERLGPEIRRQLAKQRVITKALKKAEDAAAKAEAEGSPPDLNEVNRLVAGLNDLLVPLAPRFFTDDVTPEALSQLLSRYGGRFAVLSAEGGVFELMAGRYGNNGAPNFEVYLKGHSGDSIRVDRVIRNGEYINFPALTIGLTFQPDVLRGLASKPGFRGRGLLARFVYVLPVSPVGTRVVGAPPIRETTARRYERNVLELLRNTPEPTDPLQPPLIRFEDSAREVIESFERKLEPWLAEDGALGEVADWGAKLTGAIARLAAILHIAALKSAISAVNTPISAETAKDAVELGRFFLPHARAAFAEMGADPEVERAKHVLAWLRRKDLNSFTVREAFQGLRGRFQKVTELRPALQLLVEHGYLRLADSESRRGSGRPPSERFEVNPLWNRNSEDIEDIEEATQDFDSGSVSSQVSSCATNDTSKSSSDTVPQNPHNPQNPGSNLEHDADDEVAL